MPANTSSSQDLLGYLQANGPTPSSELVAHFGISRPTLSRRVQALGHAIISIGHARATRLAARHRAFAASVPLYRILECGQIESIGQLSPISDGEHTQWHLKSSNAPATLFEGEFKDGLYPGWPWFLEDLRPAGFLGRSFGRYMADMYQIDKNPEKWSDLDLLKALMSHGFNLHGNFLIGDGRALGFFQDNKIRIADGQYKNVTPQVYANCAASALNLGEEYGSSAGGEQPKFTIIVCDTPEDQPRAAIIKFSPTLDSASGQRWADLLYAEHIANEMLRAANFTTAQTRTFRIDDRVFLESSRFDRVGSSGRRGLVSLRALDAAHLGLGQGSWAKAARKLHVEKWITYEDSDRMIQLHCFGELIANTDMHWGNLSFFLPEQSPYPLAPVYDMLPMFFRPSSTGEVIERRFKPTLPKPEDQAAWLEMMPHAQTYWQRITEHPDITTDFKTIATEALQSLRKIEKLAV